MCDWRIEQLTELLDIPQLLEACVHNELYDEALDVIQFAHETFETRNGHAAPNFVIATLVQSRLRAYCVCCQYSMTRECLYRMDTHTASLRRS